MAGERTSGSGTSGGGALLGPRLRATALAAVLEQRLGVGWKRKLCGGGQKEERVRVTVLIPDLGAKICGAELSAEICGAELSAKICGAELSVTRYGSEWANLGATVSRADQLVQSSI